MYTEQLLNNVSWCILQLPLARTYQLPLEFLARLWATTTGLGLNVPVWCLLYIFALNFDSKCWKCHKLLQTQVTQTTSTSSSVRKLSEFLQSCANCHLVFACTWTVLGRSKQWASVFDNYLQRLAENRSALPVSGHSASRVLSRHIGGLKVNNVGELAAALTAFGVEATQRPCHAPIAFTDLGYLKHWGRWDAELSFKASLSFSTYQVRAALKRCSFWVWSLELFAVLTTGFRSTWMNIFTMSSQFDSSPGMSWCCCQLLPHVTCRWFAIFRCEMWICRLWVWWLWCIALSDLLSLGRAIYEFRCSIRVRESGTTVFC